MIDSNHFAYYILLLALVAFEGEFAMLAGAGAAASGFLNFWGVLLVSSLGNIVSDTLWVALGYYSRIETLLGRMTWLGITPQRLETLKDFIRRDVVKLLVIAKVTNWMTIPALIAIGAARTAWRRWFPVVLLSDIIIAVIMVPLGYYATFSLLQIQKGTGYIALGATLLLALFAVFYGRRRLSRKNPLAEENKDTLSS